MVTEYCMGVSLFDAKSDFYDKCENILVENFNEDLRFMKHPYTDVYALKAKFDFSCINISIGYYQYHTRNEYVVIEDVYNGIETGKKMIESLGYKKYEYKLKEDKYFLL